MPNTYACKGVSNPNVPMFPPRVCTLVLFINPWRACAARVTGLQGYRLQVSIYMIRERLTRFARSPITLAVHRGLYLS